ncbi:uncharacterized protein APUU_80882S [Aspergillus puulaauensis]|uniref:DUF6536 domain-containing protein n=1 Tax=Aspergillus puulaauensis TaxID=1220207 RepID=A0A7R8ASN9_9EURO|nr:uncharacterized protein APUU_80882S [Aspergillus puulaauensis]BCS30579.1 hypothetical protein APUU_80882S [Aspergillus puulaauensis]
MMRNPNALILSITAPRRQSTLEDDVDNYKVPEPGANRVEKWKRTLYMGSVTSATVLLLNLVMVLWASLRDSDGGTGVLRVDNCERIKQLSTGVHLLINILSTLLLASSNFAMQCLAAPTRRDVDRAHARGKWLDIGVPSVRNLRQLPRLRLLLWLCLVLSSVPLHLFYNSTIYSSLSVNMPGIFVANSSFASLTAADITTAYNEQYTKAKNTDTILTWYPDTVRKALRLLRNSDTLERLSPEQCISEYATDFISKYNSVIIVSREFKGSDLPVESLASQTVPNPFWNLDVPYFWICKYEAELYARNNCTNSRLSDLRARDDWVVGGYKVDYCLAEQTAEKCTLEYNMPLAIAVMVANLAKAVLIFLVAFLLEDNPLLTVGDAVTSFLQSPDDARVVNCLLSRPMLSGKRWRNISADKPRAYIAKPKRRWSSLSRTRWASFLSMCVTHLASLHDS